MNKDAIVFDAMVEAIAACFQAAQEVIALIPEDKRDAALKAAKRMVENGEVQVSKPKKRKAKKAKAKAEEKSVKEELPKKRGRKPKAENLNGEGIPAF